MSERPPSKLLLASPDDPTLAILGKYLDSYEGKHRPTEIIRAKTLVEVHELISAKDHPTSVLFDAHFESHDGDAYEKICAELAVCKDRYLTLLLANGNSRSDQLKGQQAEAEKRNVDGLATLRGLQTDMPKFLLTAEWFRLHPKIQKTLTTFFGRR